MKPYCFHIDEDLEAGLKTLKARDGTPEAESLRRALRRYLERKRLLLAHEHRRMLPARPTRSRARR